MKAEIGEFFETSDREVAKAIVAIHDAIQSTSVTARNATEHRRQTLQRIHGIASKTLGIGTEDLLTQLQQAEKEVDVLRRTVNDIAFPHSKDEPDAALSDVQRLTKRLEEANRRIVELERDRAIDKAQLRGLHAANQDLLGTISELAQEGTECRTLVPRMEQAVTTACRYIERVETILQVAINAGKSPDLPSVQAWLSAGRQTLLGAMEDRQRHAGADQRERGLGDGGTEQANFGSSVQEGGEGAIQLPDVQSAAEGVSGGPRRHSVALS